MTDLHRALMIRFADLLHWYGSASTRLLVEEYPLYDLLAVSKVLGEIEPLLEAMIVECGPKRRSSDVEK